MTWSSPALLGLMGLALPVIALYVLKVKRQEVAVPQLKLWRELLVETRARTLWARLKQLLSLLLQLLILLGLVAALAQPNLELRSVKKESIVVLLDVSASMGAIEDPIEGRTRFDLMLDGVRDLIEGRSYEDEMMLVGVSDRIEVLTPFSRNTIQLRETLEDLKPTHRILDIAAVEPFFSQVTGDRANPLAIVITDGAMGRFDELADRIPEFQLLRVGEATSNVGITRFSVRKNPSEASDYVLASFRNFGSEPAEVRYELTLQEPGGNSRTAKVKDTVLEPGEERIENWVFDLPGGASMEFHLSAEDDRLPVDDTAWAIVEPAILKKIILVTPDLDAAEPFRLAFSSMGQILAEDTFVTTTEAYPTLPEGSRRADITIVLNELPDGLPTAGNLILLNTELPPGIPAQVVGIDPSPLIWKWDREHLLNRYLNLSDLQFPPARVLKLDDGQGLMESLEGSLLAAFEDSESKAVYVSFDVLAEFFPFRLAFPILLRNAIAWFERDSESLLRATYAPGATIQPQRQVPGETAHVRFLREGETVSRTLPLRDGRFQFTETEEPGAYVFEAGGLSSSTSVNVFAHEESSIDPLRPEQVDDEDLNPASSGHILNRDLWSLLAMLALGLWTLEWFTYHRRITE